MAEKNHKKRKAPRQSWKPHWLPNGLYKLWIAAWSALKVALCALVTVLMICVVCVFVFVGLLGTYLEEDILPNSEMVKENYDLDETSYIHYVDSNGNIQELQEIYTTTDREWAYYDEIPQALIDAAVAIEDKRFYEHQGVDWITTVKACAGMFFGSGDAGGSTITQQLVKNMTEDNSVTVRRKVVEIFKAQDFEKRYDKDTVMEWYLNLIYFGDRKNGVKSAAAHYFGKELQSLTPAECASLISITNNPSIFSPYASTFVYDGELMTGAERNRIRQVNTLWEMRNQGYLTEEEYQAALAQEMVFKSGIADEDRMSYCENEDCGYQGIVSTLKKEDDTYYCPECDEKILVSANASQTVYSWFVDTVIEDVAAELAKRDDKLWDDLTENEQNVYLQLIQRGGYHIYTTLDMEVQKQVDAVYTDLEQIPETKGAQQLQSGIVVIDNRTGDIVAIAGGVGEKIVFDAFSMATDAERQVGSSFKPIGVYAPAFELGVITPASVIKDLPLQYNEDENGKVTAFPRNAEKYYSYSMTVLDGIAESVNAVAINTLDMIGTRYSYNFAKDLFRISGLSEEAGDMNLSPLGLGGLSNGATVRDMASAYATFANQQEKGVYREGRTYTKVYDSEGNLVIDNTQDSEKILSEKTVDYVSYCLDKAVDDGTGTMADIEGMDVCGKTGTTNSRKDRYFCGYTGYYTAAIWCGFEMPAEIELVGNTKHPAARLFKQVMEPLHDGLESIPLYDESKMVDVVVCLESGKLATDECDQDIRGLDRTKRVKVYKEDVPEEYCDAHISLNYCAVGEAVANEYCEKFAQIGTLILEKRSLVKMTRSQIDELERADAFGLSSKYVSDSYIYQVNRKGEPVEFSGIFGDLNTGGEPCKTCTVHTKESWEQYKADNPWIEPTVPAEPAPTDPEPTEPAPTDGTPGVTDAPAEPVPTEEEGDFWQDLWPFD